MRLRAAQARRARVYRPISTIRYETPLLFIWQDIHPDYPTDLLAFLVIVYLTVRSNVYKFQMPSLFRTIFQDATHYFLIIFTSHLVLSLTLILGRVRTLSHRSIFNFSLSETFVVFDPTTTCHVSDVKIHPFSYSWLISPWNSANIVYV